jgi:hypothetical protein
MATQSYSKGINMRNIFLICILFTLGKSLKASSLKTISNDEKKIDSAGIINALYKGFKVVPSLNGSAFNYKYTYTAKSKAIKVFCTKKIGNINIAYNIELKDTKGIFNKNSFFIGDDYRYVNSFFMLDGVKLSLGKVHALNIGEDFLRQFSNVWSGDKSSPFIKLYSTGKRKIFLIKGINPFCNGHNCSSYVVYILQKEGKMCSVHPLYFDGTNHPYDFNNLKLFYSPDDANLSILVPKGSGSVKSKADVNVFKIYLNDIGLK